MGEEKINQEQESSLEARLQSLVNTLKDDLKILLICRKDGSIIIGNIASKTYLDYENDSEDDDEGELPEDQDKLNPISMTELVQRYIG